MSNSLETEALLSKAADELGSMGSWMRYRTVPLSHQGAREESPSRMNLCEIRAGVLGAFVVGEETVCHTILDSKAAEYQLRADDVMASIGSGLERLRYFGSREKDYANFMVDRVSPDVFRPFEPAEDGAYMLAGVQAMFDSEHGHLRPELVFDSQLEDTSLKVRDFSIDLSFEYPGIVKKNEAVNHLTNMDEETMKRLTLSFSQVFLPECIDEFYRTGL